MTKTHISQIVSAFLVGILTSGLIVKFQHQIEELSAFHTLVIGIILLLLAVLVLIGPGVLVRAYKFQLAEVNSTSMTIVVAMSIYIFVLLFSILCITGLLFLATAKLPSRENILFYLANIGPFLGLIGVSANILFNIAIYLATERDRSFFDSIIIMNIVYFVMSIVVVYGLSDQNRISPVSFGISLGFGGSSFGLAAGAFKGYLRGSFEFIGQVARQMREKDEKLKTLGQLGGAQRKRGRKRTSR